MGAFIQHVFLFFQRQAPEVSIQFSSNSTTVSELELTR